MAVGYNLSVPKSNLQLLLDASNRKSYNGYLNLLSWANWTTGPGGITGYNQNGATAENERVNATDPWGNTNVVWESRPTGGNDADGGWDTSYFSIDRTKLYRFSVWVRRTSSTTGGTFYFGMYDNVGSIRMDNGSTETNAYWDCRNISWMTQNQWYLVVGHVYPFNTTYTGRHPDTGVYTISGGKISDIGGCNIGSGDLKWNPTAISGLHRTYHYYCPDTTSRLQFHQPRVDLVDGSEPTISELLSNVSSTLFDLSGSKRNFIWQTMPSFTRSSSKCYISTANNKLTGPASNSFNINNGTGYTVIMVSNTQDDVGNTAFKFYSSALYNRGIFLHPGWTNYTMYFDQGGCCAASQRTEYTFTLSDMRNFRVWAFRSRLYDRSIFMNGVSYINNTTYSANVDLNSTAANIGATDEGTWNGQLAYFALYNTGLDDSTILNISNSLATRFGI